MITFKTIIVPGNRRKDGTYPVVIRVTFKGKSRRLATSLICIQSDLTRSLHVKNPDMLNKADAIIAEMRQAVSALSPFELEERDVDWVVGRIRKAMAVRTFSLDFFDWADEFMQTRTGTTRAGYQTAVFAFARFMGGRKCQINDITRAMVRDFCNYISSERIADRRNATRNATTTDLYVSLLAKIFNSARDHYNDDDAGCILIPATPFAKLALPRVVSRGQRSIGRELMQRIISFRTDDPFTRFALDAFVVSFGTMGANLADLYAAPAFSGETWAYNRQKTRGRRADGAPMEVRIDARLEPFLARLKGSGPRWLNVMSERHTTKDAAMSSVNGCLHRWAKDNGVPDFTFYAARHTWATLARNDCRIDKATVDECLCHVGNYQIADVYIERSWDLLADANRKVLDLFSWPEE